MKDFEVKESDIKQLKRDLDCDASEQLMTEFLEHSFQIFKASNLEDLKDRYVSKVGFLNVNECLYNLNYENYSAVLLCEDDFNELHGCDGEEVMQFFLMVDYSELLIEYLRERGLEIIETKIGLVYKRYSYGQALSCDEIGKALINKWFNTYNR